MTTAALNTPAAPRSGRRCTGRRSRAAAPPPPRRPGRRPHATRCAPTPQLIVRIGRQQGVDDQGIVDRARRRGPGVGPAQRPLRRPRLARPVPAASEHRLGNPGPGARPALAPPSPSSAAPRNPNTGRTRGLLDIPGWQLDERHRRPPRPCRSPPSPTPTPSGRRRRAPGSPSSADERPRWSQAGHGPRVHGVLQGSRRSAVP